MYYRSGALLVVASAVMLGVGLWRLARTGRWTRAGVIVGAIVAFPAVMVALTHIEDTHLRLWVAFLVVPLLVPWLMIGFSSSPKNGPLAAHALVIRRAA